ncbi:hypothetical protein MAPG_00425 [Magnaporthiopsis poae ATCC 64411]|uniref:Uncharacterized protein n=1 Tax=Magnaporthiopsis poae (strain ATCC 64411 / 73-15) TaxID=644358 RepID=A0A0C4DKZ3_MAGP6|nr:hypothetical protein MAPG_00425 [Magnaporthiopsis poae ATCC 64411]
MKQSSYTSAGVGLDVGEEWARPHGLAFDFQHSPRLSAQGLPTRSSGQRATLLKRRQTCGSRPQPSHVGLPRKNAGLHRDGAWISARQNGCQYQELANPRTDSGKAQPYGLEVNANFFEQHTATLHHTHRTCNIASLGAPGPAVERPNAGQSRRRGRYEATPPRCSGPPEDKPVEAQLARRPESPSPNTLGRRPGPALFMQNKQSGLDCSRTPWPSLVSAGSYGGLPSNVQVEGTPEQRVPPTPRSKT